MEREKEILEFWRKNGIFAKTLSARTEGKPFVFYDGPPFATGLPHYGHVLAGTIKDAIPRYQTMRGRYVRREWGWDCHGLPLENIVEQELGLSHKRDIEAYGIDKFNAAAKKAVRRYEREWKDVIPRTGRFVDMERPYSTMDASYTESVWWSFRTLWDKKLVYEGYKIMHVCPRCETSLAQSEVAGSYKDVTDISVTAKFKIKNPEKIGLSGEVFLLAWTTTPWTLPGNTALAVGRDIDYVFDRIQKVIVARARAEALKISMQDVQDIKGNALVGLEYEPLYDYYSRGEIKNKENGWKVYPGKFVTTESGTGIVHVAPAFGEDDYNLCNEFDLPFVQHVGLDGRIRDEVSDFGGRYVKQKGDTQSTDIEIIKNLAARGLLFAKEKLVHSYPLCWRCDTPLINYATSSWFVKVTDFKNKLVKENKKVSWVPAHMKDGRFGKWLEGAKDWAVSRSRFWGAPLPVWRCAACKKTEVMGRLEDLQKRLPRSGNRYFALRHGHARSNGTDIIDSEGNPENHLTDSGKAQAAAAVAALKKAGITRIVHSPLIRAKETAEIVAAALGISGENIETDERLREIRFGIFDGKPVTDYRAFFDTHDHFTEAPEGGETHTELKRRVMTSLDELESKYKKENILIVTHESAMWMLYAGARGMTGPEALLWRGERDEVVTNGETLELPYLPYPHNEDWELDYHRPYIDGIAYPCACGGEMERIPEVFDCWYESGSMPYAQFHYPFENEKEFNRNFPADFIAEGLDQTRGWFYSMMVLGVALFGETPYRHVIVNGIVLAEDGQKMSKRLKNYPDVMEVIEKYGADALRYYLLSSPVMRGEDLNFSEKSVAEISRKIIGRLMNVHTFYATYERELKDAASWKQSKNPLDSWIRSRLAELREEITSGMEAYELDAASRGIDLFVDDLSTWYLRRSRERFKGDDALDREWALSTTRLVLLELSKLMAPFIPFVAEDLYQKVKGKSGAESVHLEMWPEAAKADKKILAKMKTTRSLVEAALAARAEAGIKVRQPLALLSVPAALSEFFPELVMDEVNVKDVVKGVEVKLDVKITAELRKEGHFRELTRAVQELRKENGLTPRDRATLVVETDAHGKKFIHEFEESLMKATLLKEIAFEKNEGKKVAIDGLEFVISIKK